MSRNLRSPQNSLQTTGLSISLISETENTGQEGSCCKDSEKSHFQLLLISVLFSYGICDCAAQSFLEYYEAGNTATDPRHPYMDADPHSRCVYGLAMLHLFENSCFYSFKWTPIDY